MNIIDIIVKKKNKEILTYDEIKYTVDNFIGGEVKDYQMSSLLMAIVLNGMSEEEIFNLTKIMLDSGDKIDLSKINGIKVDKHSTGGVGDKTTLVVGPLAAACGVPIAKMSGKGLGFTGGTIDKLESIKGFNTNISEERFINQVNDIGISLVSQSGNLVPADKKIYALRDVTGTTESIPLIASSIMSKKIAAGANKIVLDVTCGSGAFMKNIEDATKLAETMKKIGELAKKETTCIITNMNEPLGKAIGNSLEVIEAIEFLKGNMQSDVQEVILTLGAYMIKLASKGENIEANKEKMLEQIQSGKAFKKLEQWIQKQGGDITYLENTEKFEKAKFTIPVVNDKDGYVKELLAEEIGKASMNLGAGRKKKEDNIDFSVGIILEKKTGDKVKKGENLAYIYANDENLGQIIAQDVLKAYTVVDEIVDKKQDILKIL